MRVALLAESFLPHMNGVTGSVLQVLRHLEREGHEALVIAPGAASSSAAADVHGARTSLLRSVPLPSYPEVRVAVARTAHLTRTLRDFAPDVVHLASPFVLGWQGVTAADALGVPSVAVYQTDVAAYAEKYGVPGMGPLVSGHVARLHRRATLTLAPSRAAARQLETLGVDRVRSWGRGVDTARFTPARRSAAWRQLIAPGETLVGYVGRLAPEKQVEDLRALTGLSGVRLVIVGDGPERARLQALLPDAVFTGFLGGDALAEALASFDVFVHPGESETFCQTVQEAHASGVPVVATGRGGPLDLVRSSIDGWLYEPGDLADLRARVADLAGDEAKRRSFGAAAREAVRDRTWEALCRQLIGHYEEARMLRPIDDALLARAATRPAAPPAPASVAGRPRWTRYIALGDSITEGLCDSSRVPDGQYRGWADRLALLLAHAGRGRFRYANLAVRSRRVRDVLEDQIPAALALAPDLVSVLIGANDLVRIGANPVALARSLEGGVRKLRNVGCDVLLVTPFLPRRPAARVLLAAKFAAFASELRRVAEETGSLLLDVEALPALGAPDMWADDRVHLRTIGHRFLAYRAAELLGVPDAEALGELDAALHTEDEDPGVQPTAVAWLRGHALPWVLRRMAGRAAGDGRSAKHDGYVLLRPRETRHHAEA
ncbi:glycosyl transferase [Microbacterium sp. Root61]|uniref:GDSL-type esterase/lipase family protein n=1 Tax=Microbacterium sp. Root61 TaxID=1736570 RepID=UPI000701C82D|nr:GDSL-type esterase/lipase family protein [Microbacterium sp. Root61]KRA22422.1 glycosyl transferase [Microbacterium sp. Root61]